MNYTPREVDELTERISELESELDGYKKDNRDLLEDHNRLDDEVTDLLFQLDEMRDIVAKSAEARFSAEEEMYKLREEIADLVLEAGHWRRKAEENAIALQSTGKNWAEAAFDASRAEARAENHWEAAKRAVRERNYYRKLFNKYHGLFVQRDSVIYNIKKALGT